MTKKFTDQNFMEEVLQASSEKPVLVDFYADWCGPCKMQGPVVDQLAEEMGDKAIIGKVDTEVSQKTAMEYGIMSIPTLLIFRNGKVVSQAVGMQSKGALKATLEENM